MFADVSRFSIYLLSFRHNGSGFIIILFVYSIGFDIVCRPGRGLGALFSSIGSCTNFKSSGGLVTPNGTGFLLNTNSDILRGVPLPRISPLFARRYSSSLFIQYIINCKSIYIIKYIKKI